MDTTKDDKRAIKCLNIENEDHYNLNAHSIQPKGP